MIPNERGHIDYVCAGNHDHSHCMFCDGGLWACAICGSFEGMVVTHCPGYLMPYEANDPVYNGQLDFMWGRWLNVPSEMARSIGRVPV
jgi:hypothetical protein